MVKKRLRVFALLSFLVLIFSLSASAESTGKSYVYNHSKNANEIPDPYQVSQVFGSELKLNAPEDMTVHNDQLYILDAGNNRIVVTDKAYKLLREIKLHTGEEQFTFPYDMKEPKGIWVDEKDRIYIADRSKHVITITDGSGRVLKELGKPDTPLMSQGTEYLPEKVLTDSLGVIYVKVANEYRGFVTLNYNGDFLGYFGSNKVATSASVMMDLFWRHFMTAEQIAKTQKLLPMEYSNFSIDGNGFIYGVRGTTSSNTELIRKLNSKSINVLNNTGQFGEGYLGKVKGVTKTTNFNAVTIDSEGFITALDTTWNRLFQYTSDGENMFVFGGKGDQEGTFKTPVDVESWNDQLLVLDKDFSTITIMKPTEFGNNVRNAESLYSKGDYLGSLQPWQDVLSKCMNYEFAYTGIGKALYMDGNYKEAMSNFKISHDQADYSLSYKMYRTEQMQGMLTPIMTVLVLLLVVCFVYGFLKKRGIIKSKKLVLDESGKLKYLAHVTLHPVEGYEEMRYNKKYSLGIANVLMLLFVFSQILKALYTGFNFNETEVNTYNVFITLGSTIGVIALFALSNWLMATFLDGKGRLKEMWIYLCYALLPLIIGTIVYIIFSQGLSLDEKVFLNWILQLAQIWTGVMIFFAIKGLHMYTVKRTIFSIFVTIIVMLVVLFIIFLIFNLFIQFASFLETIYKEAMYRIAVGF